MPGRSYQTIYRDGCLAHARKVISDHIQGWLPCLCQEGRRHIRLSASSLPPIWNGLPSGPYIGMAALPMPGRSYQTLSTQPIPPIWTVIIWKAISLHKSQVGVVQSEHVALSSGATQYSRVVLTWRILVILTPSSDLTFGFSCPVDCRVYLYVVSCLKEHQSSFQWRCHMTETKLYLYLYKHLQKWRSCNSFLLTKTCNE